MDIGQLSSYYKWLGKYYILIVALNFLHSAKNMQLIIISSFLGSNFIFPQNVFENNKDNIVSLCPVEVSKGEIEALPHFYQSKAQ